MHPRPETQRRPNHPRQLLATDGDGDFFLDCASCGCSSCLWDRDDGDGARAPAGGSPFRWSRAAGGRPTCTARNRS